MAATLSFAAVDLGAESGRVALGRFDGSALALEEVYRFPNVPVRVHGSLQWDVLRLWGDVQHGLASCVPRASGPLASLGVAGWGVDFGLLGHDGHLLGNPVHYRDGLTNGMMEEAFRRVPRAEIYRQTGIQLMPINTLYQLLALAESRSPALEAAAALLTIPDLFHYWLSGSRANELSNATTTQCFKPGTGEWAWDLLDRLGIPARIFGPIVPPGTVLGPVRPAVAGELGLSGVPVIAPATHDTGSAVAAVPMEGREAIYLSSGTWSLMGVEVSQPVIDERGRTVIAGPVEATALGNVLVQAIAGGHLASLEEGRALIRRSCPVQIFEPCAAEMWESAYQRYLRLKG